jgi:hypothetical protein
MNRYTTSIELKTDSGFRRKATVILAAPVANSNDTYIQVTSAELLTTLAYKFYDDVASWWIIAAANGLGKGTLIVPADTILRIPSNKSIDSIINEINRIR